MLNEVKRGTCSFLRAQSTIFHNVHEGGRWNKRCSYVNSQESLLFHSYILSAVLLKKNLSDHLT